jgi:regulatory protein
MAQGPDQQKGLAGKAAKRRVPRKATAKSLENAALWYLTRYATSGANLERVLARRVDRSARHHGTDREEGMAIIDRLIARYRQSGLLDDRAYAIAKAGTLNRRGKPVKAIAFALRAKGVTGEDIDEALLALKGEGADPDMGAAARYARRRRLGPFRAAPEREERRQRDLAALARAGFGYDVARRVIEAESPGDVEAGDGTKG